MLRWGRLTSPDGSAAPIEGPGQARRATAALQADLVALVDQDLGASGLEPPASRDAAPDGDHERTAGRERDRVVSEAKNEFHALAPNCAFVLEIISEFQRPLPYLRDDFWTYYSKVRPREFAKYLNLAKQGKERPAYVMPKGEGSQTILAAYQKSELEKSLKYCKDVLGLGT